MHSHVIAYGVLMFVKLLRKNTTKKSSDQSQIYSNLFCSIQLLWLCQVPPIDNSTVYPNLTESDILNYTTPYDGSYQYCYKYGYDYNTCDGTLSCANQSANSIQCDQGYWYDRSIFTETVITEFNLVCQRSYLIPLSTSMYYVGMLVGSFLFGNVADRYGRKPTFIVTTILAIGCYFGTTFSISVEMYSVFRALLAAFRYGGTIATFVYIMEIVGAKYRTMFGMIYHITYVWGFMVLSGLAYVWRDWHELMFVISVLSVPVLFVAIAVPESPRWLFAMEREKQGMKVTNIYAKLNGVKLTDEDWNEARKAGEEKLNELSQLESGKKYSFLDLFKTPGIRLTTFKVMFSWFVNSFVYYGISLNAGSLAGDIFVNNTLNGVFEFASYVFCWLTLDRIGRRRLLSGMYFVSGVGLLASVIVNEYAGDNQSLITLGVVFAFIAKFGISGAFGCIYNFTSELYPTVVRSTGMGNGSVASRIGGISAPYVISLQNIITWLPNSLFGSFAVIAGVVALSYPETNGKPIMETIEQAEIFYKTGEVVNLSELANNAKKENDSQPVSENGAVDLGELSSNSSKEKELPVDSLGCDNLGFNQQETVTSVQF
uniref:Organic cation transporter protein-like n=1 Tax=Phallusia mammillata TaxID=59560 RepID=A0A6F9DT10_9ASCI|nr:organic cation transporter protein-like [Phallusia mammillata]